MRVTGHNYDPDAKIEWLIQDLIPMDGQTTLYGKPGSYKSMLAMYWAIQIAKEHRVIYLDYEMARRWVNMRLRDMLGDDVLPLLEGPLWYEVEAGDSIGPLDTPQGSENLADLIHQADATVLFIDSMADATEGSENDNDTIRRFSHHTASMLKGQEITTIRIDHISTKSQGDTGPRGASRKMDDVDLAWKVALTGNEEQFQLVNGKDRIGIDQKQFYFSIEKTPLLHVTRQGQTSITIAALTDKELELLERIDDAIEAGELDYMPGREKIMKHIKYKFGTGPSNQQAQTVAAYIKQRD